MLNNYQHKASLGLSLWLSGMFSASAQDLLEPLPPLPSPGEQQAVPGVVPELPSAPENQPLPNLPPAPSDPVAPLPPEFIPPSEDPNPMIPGSDLVPSPAPVPILPDGMDNGDLLTEDGEAPDPPTFLEDDDATDTEDDTPEAFQNIGGLSFNGGQRDAETEGFTFGLRFIESYTSNLQIADTGGDATLYTQISPSASYRSAPEGQARFILAASYTPTFSIYHSGSEGTTLDHELDSSLTYEGEKLIVGISGSYALVHAANRFTGTFAESINSEFRINSTYSLSEKTTLFANAEYQTRTTDIGDMMMGPGPNFNGDSDTLALSTSALWVISPKLSLGPSLRYALNSSDAFGSANSIGLSGEIRYTFSEKTKIASTLGVERISFPGSGDDYAPTGTIRLDYKPSPVLSIVGEARYEAIPLTQANVGGAIGAGNPLFEEQLNGPASDGGQQLNASIGVTYRPSELWRLGAGFSHRTAPSFIRAGESVVDTGITLSAAREIGQGSLSMNLSNNFTDSESNGTTGTDDQDFRQISLIYVHPALTDNLSFSGELSYSESSGSIPFDETQAAVTLSYRF